jgi:hypothetical protein
MFNSPVLDVAIGLVFIFLLYSLLATSIKEAIATLFALRARMLKNGIVESMLSCTHEDNRWASILKGIKEFVLEIAKIFIGKREKNEKEKNIGDKFYEHPLIKNYGSSRIYPTPSYIPTENFSTVLIDVLKQDFKNKLDEIAQIKYQNPKQVQDIEGIKNNISNSNDAQKIKYLLDYYLFNYSNKKKTANGIIDEETGKILSMHLKNSVYDIEAFSKKLGDWFDDSMNRVSGWYKRQVQVILFMIGLVMAIMFNVDIIQIADKLTTDKDARDKVVQLAIKGSEQYKDDPRVIPPKNNKNDGPDKTKKSEKEDSIRTKKDEREDSIRRAKNDTIFKEYQEKLDNVKKELKGNIDTANNLLAIGWAGYGRNDSSFLNILQDKTWLGFFYIDDSKRIMDSVKKLYHDSLGNTGYDTTGNGDRSKLLNAFYKYQYAKYPVHVKKAFIWYSLVNQKKKWLGYLILAFAVCLGAPFWFDLLNKLIKLRATGKKEDSNSNDTKQTANQQQPVNLNVNTQKTGEEAVG